MTNEAMAKRIVARILEDLTDRRGLRQAWDSIDDDIKAEIVTYWETKTAEELRKTAG